MKYSITFNSVETMTELCTKYNIDLDTSLTVEIPVHLVSTLFRAGHQIDESSNTTESFLVKPADPKSTIGVASSFGLRVVTNDSYLSLLADPQFVDVLPAESNIKLMVDVVASSSVPPEDKWPQIRVTSRFRPFNVPFDQIETAKNVEVFLLDSGINDHSELANVNIVNLYSFVDTYTDIDGHGTAIASLIAGENVGVMPSKAVTILNCKVFDHDTRITATQLVECIDVIVKYQKADPKPRVANLSWCVTKSVIFDSIIETMVDAGIVVVCAAGNGGTNANDLSPANIGNVITVGSINQLDRVSVFSNSGSCVDLLAPGEEVTCVWNGEYLPQSGTSLAAAITTGATVGAIIMFGDLAQQALLDLSTTNAIFDIPENQPNKIVYCPLNANQTAKYAYVGYIDHVKSSKTVDINMVLIDQRMVANGARLNILSVEDSTGMVSFDDTTLTLTYTEKEKSSYVLNRSIDQCQVTIGLDGSKIATVTLWWFSLPADIAYDDLPLISAYTDVKDRAMLATYINSFPADLHQTGPAFDSRLTLAGGAKT